MENIVTLLNIRRLKFLGELKKETTKKIKEVQNQIFHLQEQEREFIESLKRINISMETSNPYFSLLPRKTRSKITKKATRRLKNTSKD